MRAEIDSRPGSPLKPNEDWAAATNRVAIVLDGLTAPTDLDTGCIHGVPWYADRLGSLLVAWLAHDDIDICDALANAIDDVAKLHSATCDLDSTGTPSATVVAVRFRADKLDWLVLADSTLILDHAGTLEVISDDRVSQLNQVQQHEAIQGKVGTAEQEHSVSRLIEAQRQIRNQPGGYWVAAANPAAAHEAVHGIMRREEVRRLALLSDGSARLHEFGLANWGNVLEILETNGPTGLINAVRDVEKSDPHGSRWPRYKASDDATAIYITL